jgi:hypothetical protein
VTNIICLDKTWILFLERSIDAVFVTQVSLFASI